MTTTQDPEVSTFQNRPAYRYIRTADKLPRISALAEVDDPIATVKIFDPTGGWTWYIAAYDPETRIAFALVDGLELEAGDVSMEELVDHRGRFGLPLERDINWTPKPFSAIQGPFRAGGGR